MMPGAILYPNAERYLKSAEQNGCPLQAVPDPLANTLAIASAMPILAHQPADFLPDFPVPDGESVSSYLRRLTCEGAVTGMGN